MPTYSDSKGNRYTTKQIDDKVRLAKAERLKLQFEEHGWNFCEQCGSNGSGTRLDCSHDISVKKAKEEGKAELAWNVGNIVVRCRDCHNEHDGTKIQLNWQ